MSGWALALGLRATSGTVSSRASALTADPTGAILRAARAQMERCAMRLPPHEQLRVTLTLVIAPDGHVRETGIDERARGARGCVRDVAAGLVFPADRGGAVRELSVPLILSR